MKVVDGKLYDKHSKSIGTTGLALGLLIPKTTLDLMTNYIALIIVTDDFDTPEKVIRFLLLSKDQLDLTFSWIISYHFYFNGIGRLDGVTFSNYYY